MEAVKWTELFPTNTSIVVFVVYILLYINQGVLITSTQGLQNEYDYNIVTVVLLTEVLKLIISAALYCKEGGCMGLVKEVSNNRKLVVFYSIPAFLYCLYNYLSFINLLTFDPTTYYLLLQFRVVITGILFMIIFKKALSRIQWISFVLLIAGCMLKEFDFEEDMVKSRIEQQKNTNGFDFSIDTIYILVQILCSSFAGVCTKYLSEQKGADVNIYVQNVFLYLASVICSILVLIVTGDIFTAFSVEHLSVVFQLKVILILINNAAAGILTSIFFKFLSPIVKTFAVGVKLLFTALIFWHIFSIPVHANTVLAILVSTYSMYLYVNNPVLKNL